MSNEFKVWRADELSTKSDFFEVLATTKKTQVAVMNLGEGEVSGEFGTDHPQADQLLYIIEGSGSVKVGDQEKDLDQGDLVLIPAGAPHQVRGPNRSISFYGPVAYPEEGE